MSIETYDRPTKALKTDEEKAEVRKQLNRLLETSHFRNSKRYPPLFRFIVEETLEGRGEFLKERLLGVRVFDRPADYDTASDPIVRVTIAEIRKRIAQYYHEDAHESEMRIELSPGRYEPEFRLRSELPRERLPVPPAAEETFSHAIVPAIAEAVSEGAAPGSSSGRWPRRLRWAAVSSGAAALLVVGGWFGWRGMHPAAIDQFWGPILRQRGDLTVCIPTDAGSTSMSGEARVVSGVLLRSTEKNANAWQATEKKQEAQTFLEHESFGENVVFSDVRAAMQTSEYVIEHGRKTHPIMSSEATLDNLRQGPTLLIGGLDNPWTMRTLASLRFQFEGSDSKGFWIVDRQHPEMRGWWLDLKKRYAAVDHDYAIVARIHDATTGEPEVIVAGIGTSGTIAAGELLGDPAQQEQLRRSIGPGFRDRDFEAVIDTEVVNGITGSPHILTVAVW